MQWSEYKELYARLEQDGTIARITAFEVREHIFFGEARVVRWDGYIQCSSSKCRCPNDAVFFLGGDAYCLEHTMQIVEALEHDAMLNKRVEDAQARVAKAYEGEDYDELNQAMEELELAKAALAKES